MTAGEPRRRLPRFPIAVLAAAALFLVWLWLLSGQIRQMQMIFTYVAVVFGGGALLAWWAIAGGASRRARLLPLLVVGAAAVLFALTFRVKGITGDWIPVLELRFAQRARTDGAWSPSAIAPRRAEVDGSEEEAGGGTADRSVAAEGSTGGARGEHLGRDAETTPSAAAGNASAFEAGAPSGDLEAGDHGTVTAPRDDALSAVAFPRFLGPDGDSVVRGVALARDWAADPPRLLWKRPIGAGWSGFAVSHGRAVTLEQRGGMETAVAYDLATGDELWSHGERAFFTNPMAGPGPRATPTVDGGRVFTFGSTGIAVALDLATGKLLWRHDVPREHAASIPEHGMTGSPLVVDGKVVVSAGGPDGHSLVAFDAQSGALAWHGGDDRAGYGSPALVTLAGRRQILVFNRASVGGHDPRDGSVLWSHPWPPDWPNVAPPVVVGEDRVLFSTGYGIGSKLLRVQEEDGGRLRAELVWETPRLKSKFANLVLHDGSVYGLDDGVLVCLDPETGQRRWKGGRYGHGNLLLVVAGPGGDHGDSTVLLVQTERGEMVMLDPSPDEHRELGRFMALPGKAWNPFALAGRFLLVRNDAEAALWELPIETRRQPG